MWSAQAPNLRSLTRFVRYFDPGPLCPFTGPTNESSQDRPGWDLMVPTLPAFSSGSGKPFTPLSKSLQSGARQSPSWS